jgi:hypothetical protein
MQKRKYLIIALIGLAINFIETGLFGWHWKAQSGAEHYWDVFSAILIAWGVIGDILSNVQIHKHYNDTSTTNITTKTVKVGGKPVVHYNFGTTKQETEALLAGKPSKSK